MKKLSHVALAQDTQVKEGRGTPGRRTKRRSPPPPLPLDAPLMSIPDVAAYLRSTPAGVRRLLDGGRDRSPEDVELGELLRGWLVTLSPHRRYIQRVPFLTWLGQQSGEAQSTSAA